MPVLIGHHQALTLLTQMRDGGRLGSALLLVGPSGVGKRTLVDQVFGTAVNNPNVCVLNRELNDKDELKKNISIDQVRDLIARLSLSAFGGGKKIGMIDEAELLAGAGWNALLKTLEDPTGDVLIILLATSTELIPATVLSRCQTVHLGLVASSEIVEALVARGASVDQASEIAAFAAGRPGVALRLLADADGLERHRQYQQSLNTLLSASVPEMIGLLGQVAKEDKSQIDEMLDCWEILLHERGQMQPLKQLIKARSAIRENVNVTLALEHAFLT